MVDMFFFELERLGSTIWKEISLWFNLYNPPLQESAGDTQYCSPLFLRGDPTKIQAEIRPKRPFQSTFRQKKATKLPQDHHDDSWPDVLFFFDLWKGPPVPRGNDGGQPADRKLCRHQMRARLLDAVESDWYLVVKWWWMCDLISGIDRLVDG
jgi:hypothetical protein